jgi:hypothetical protein
VNIQLFLAHSDDHKPVLPDGIPRDAALHAPRLAAAPPGSKRLVSIAAHSDELPEHRWGIVAPKGPDGDRLLRLIEPLRLLREEEQGAEAIVYRVDPAMDPRASAAWIQREYWDAVERHEEALPRYLLLLGGADGISFPFQQLLGGEVFVGRVAFPDDEGYEAYVEKVRRCEQRELAPCARLLFCTARDGTKASVEGHRQLMSPSLEIARENRRRGKLPAGDIVEIGDTDDQPSGDKLCDHAHSMLRAAERSSASVLFSMSHGTGAPRSGWRSPGEQRAHQGAMMLGRSGDRITAGDVSARPFLPGGAWLFFACFGAGTPVQSAYYPWLDQLHQMGFCGPAEHVLAALPKPDDPPFVAALPQAALANPAGPLGVIGHIDLAWSFSFLDHDLSPGSTAAHRRAERFQGALRALVSGHRLGVAHYELVRFSRSITSELLTLYEENARNRPTTKGSTEAEAHRARRSALWMQYQDLCAYILLGDPAARLPIGRRPPGLSPETPMDGAAERAARSGAPDLLSMEEAVLARLRGMETPAAIAARYGRTEAELERWVSAFLDAGRAALRKLR